MTGEGSGPRRKFLGQMRLDAGEQVVEGDAVIGQAPFTEHDVQYTILHVEAESLCANAAPASSGAALGSVRFWINLGLSTGGASAGQVRLDAEALTPEVYSPAALTLATAQTTAVEAVRDGTGRLLQIKAPQTFAEIVALDATSYEVRCYTPDQIGSQHATTKLYALNGSAFVTYKLENPDVAQGRSERLRVTETRSGLVRVTEFSQDPATLTWSLSQGGGLRQESEETTQVDEDRVKVTSVRDSAGQVVSKLARTYHDFAWGEELTREVLDPDGAALVTEYEYYHGNDPFIIRRP
ncbi:MAG: hypothetical protein Q7R41_00305, partial [Phycisphaerales bacterium]|nr:hypothetical protein [Phycisphaerales bacterium]